MARIAHKVPMNAYDHIVGLLEEAGGKDGIISREDATRLVEKLEAEGRGTEALAAHHLFAMIDARDQALGHRVTSHDLARDRAFVERKLLENRDTNHNGYSTEEIARMSPAGRALVELGQLLALEARRGRVPHAVPEEGLRHVASLLRSAADGDGIASREDVKRLASELRKQGRGTEALAVGMFFAFIDHRDAGHGHRVTEEDIDRAVGYAEEHLVRAKDRNHNGYSKAEIARMSTTAKAFLRVGQMIRAGILDPE